MKHTAQTVSKHAAAALQGGGCKIIGWQTPTSPAALQRCEGRSCHARARAPVHLRHGHTQHPTTHSAQRGGKLVYSWQARCTSCRPAGTLAHYSQPPRRRQRGATQTTHSAVGHPPPGLPRARGAAQQRARAPRPCSRSGRARCRRRRRRQPRRPRPRRRRRAAAAAAAATLRLRVRAAGGFGRGRRGGACGRGGAKVREVGLQPRQDLGQHGSKICCVILRRRPAGRRRRAVGGRAAVERGRAARAEGLPSLERFKRHARQRRRGEPGRERGAQRRQQRARRQHGRRRGEQQPEARAEQLVAVRPVRGGRELSRPAPARSGWGLPLSPQP